MKNAALLLVSLFSIATFSQLWQHDFSNSGDWISADLNGGSDAWIINSSAIGGSVDSISSATAGNGFAQFNSEGQCNGNHQDVTLTYFQQIDLSANALSYVEFVQHYRRKSDTVYVEFSNDGLTWESIWINKEYWYYQQTQDPDTVQVSIPSTVHSQPFWMRFRFSGECGFAWLMDDVKIFEKEQYALDATAKIRKNNFTYNRIGHCQEDTLNGRLELTNWGYESLIDVVIQTEVYVNSSLINTLLDTIPILNAEEQIMVEITDLIHLYFNGDQLEFHFKLFNSQLSDTLILNQQVISDYRISRTTDLVSGYFMGDTGGFTTGLGYAFYCSDYLCIQGADVFVPDHPDALGKLFYYSIYKLQNNELDIIVSSDDFTVMSPDQGTWLVTLLDNKVQFSPGDTGVIIYDTYYIDFPIPYSWILSQDSVFSYSDFNFTKHYEGAAAMIRPVVNYTNCALCPIGIDENNEQTLIVSPNPATDKIHLRSLVAPIQKIRIYSMDGRLVYEEKESVTTEINVSVLQNGTYLIFVETEDGTVYSEKFVKL